MTSISGCEIAKTKLSNDVSKMLLFYVSLQGKGLLSLH